MNLEIIEKVFKESAAVHGCKERLMLLTKGGGNTERLVEELWEKFSKALEIEIEKDKNKVEEDKDEVKEDKDKVEETETLAPITTENTENKDETEGKDTKGKDTEEKDTEEKDTGEKMTWHKFLSNKMKEGKKIKEIGELWKKEKEKNK